MTVSALSTQEFNRDELIVMAYQATGLLEAGKDAPPEDLALASNFMNLELQALQAEGVVLRTVERTTLTLGTPDAGTAATYTLPSDTIDVQLGPNDQVGTIIPTSGSETLVEAMSRAQYLETTDKTSAVSGTPMRAYVEKQASVTVTFWPVPDADSATFRYARVRLLRDADTGSVTIDLARRWLKFVVYATAVHLARAKSCGLDVISDLRGEAERMKAVCQADDAERGSVRFTVAHGGGRR